MQVLATVSDITRLGIVLNLESGETKIIPSRPEFIASCVTGRPAFRPFGITWNDDNLFIANNKQLLVFDKQLNFVRCSVTQMQINIHQLAYKNGRVWAVSPWTNSLISICQNDAVDAVEFDIFSQKVCPYLQREACETDDKSHFNSLLWSGAYLFIAAHAFGGESFINRYNGMTMQLDNVYRNVGSSIHGLAHDGEELFWISTKTGEIRSDLGYCQSLSRPGYARGFAVTNQYFIVAISEFLARGDRYAGDSWIQIIDRRQDSIVNEICLADTGSINELRLLDEYDFAHCVEPFWTRS
jgi:hypothetical protein